MNEERKKKAGAEIQQIVEAATRLGIELNKEEALQWLTAIAASQSSDQVVFDTRTGVFGHKVTMLDFSPNELDYFRKVGKLVEFEDVPGKIETALALSGSAAQSKIQSYPGDADYFERINVIAATFEEACEIVADLIRDKALGCTRGPWYQLIEVKFGEYPYEVTREGRKYSTGTPISWSCQEVKKGKIDVHLLDRKHAKISWDEAAKNPGWTKLDWVVADPVRGTLANTSNNLDITWEAPDGTITPLDGYLDPYFQEVYLDATSVPIFSNLS